MERITTCSLQDDFIENLTDFIEKEFLKSGKDLSRLAFVFGGKRPALFLKRNLARKIKTGFIPPRIFSMDEFIEYIVSLKHPVLKIAELDACFAVYNLAKKISPDILKDRRSFPKFLPWAREIVRFIEQFDLEDIPNTCLADVQLSAQIGYDVPANINTLLENMIILREQFHARLQKNSQYSRGSMYLKAANIIGQFKCREFDQFIFCNLFYLHKTERSIIGNLYNKGKAHLFFQGDAENWSVLSNLAQDFSISIKPQEKKGANYEVNLYAGFDKHSQAAMVRELLKKIEHPEKTVIVLPDSNAVVPLLSEITSLNNAFNVSLGYPISRSALFLLWEALSRAQATKKNDEYYVKDYLRLLTHPFIKSLRLLAEPAPTRVLVHKIEEILLGIVENPLGGSLFIRLEDIEKQPEFIACCGDALGGMKVKFDNEQLTLAVKKLHTLLFRQWENISDYYSFCLKLEGFLDVLVDKSTMANYPLNLRVLERILMIKEELANAVFNKIEFSQQEIFKVFKDKLQNEVMSFVGSPLKGLQILGLFETRSLSFENVIVMDANESVLPKLRIYEPLIPREVMLRLGLNRLEKEEEVQRYHFMRLVSSAKNVFLVYEENERKQRSRFIEEIIWQRQKDKGSLDAVKIRRGGFKVKVLSRRARVKKTQDIIERLKDFTFSASSVDTYMHCPLRFYYQYVLRLKEKEDILEDPEGLDVGNFVHKFLEEIYADLAGREFAINKNFRSNFFKLLDKRFKEQFLRRMKSDAFLLKKIFEFRLENFLNNEEKREVKQIVSLEREFNSTIKFSKDTIKFIARVDRIDRLQDGRLLIIDYKTGGFSPRPKSLDKLNAMELKRESIKNAVVSFQLPLYYYIVQAVYPDDSLACALYFLRDGMLDYYPPQSKMQEMPQIITKCLEALEFMLEEIVDPKSEFIADEEDSSYCQTCPFFYLCR